MYIYRANVTGVRLRVKGNSASDGSDNIIGPVRSGGMGRLWMWMLLRMMRLVTVDSFQESSDYAGGDFFVSNIDALRLDFLLQPM